MMDTLYIKLWIYLTICVKFILIYQTNADNYLLQKIVKEKHLKEEGFKEFTLSTIHAIFPAEKTRQRHFTRSKRSVPLSDKPFKLTFTAFNRTFTMTVKQYSDLIPAYTPVLFRSNNTIQQYAGTNPDCFLEGQTEGRGLVSLTYCHGFAGSILEGDFMYRIDPIGQVTEDMEEPIVVSRGHFKQPFNDQIGHYLLNDLHENKIRSKRGTTVSSFTIEVGIFVDAAHVIKLEDSGAITTEQKILEVAALWNGVQVAMALQEDLGYAITLQIKQIEFWATNPDWFEIDDSRGTTTLATFCDGIKTQANVLQSDHYHLHSQFIDTALASGYAYKPGTCVSSRCGITKVNFDSAFNLVAHELGHSLGMSHDGDVGCEATKGIMDASASGSFSWSSCSQSALDSFVQSANPDCLFAENVPPSEVEASVESISLDGVYEGMLYSPDEVCVNRHGTGYRNREWYNNVEGNSYCVYANCVDMNDGDNYGVITSRDDHVSGTHCQDGYVCRRSRCITWEDTRIALDKFVVVEGGWSEWGAYTSTCSRSCGTGITYRERSCNNPSPILAPYCNGSRTESEICNTQPCTGDSNSTSELIVQRASEVCADLIAKGIISSEDYDGTGDRRSSHDPGQCEAKCEPSASFNSRYALLPDGTPCSPTIPDATEADTQGYPRSRGFYGLCARGYCETFSCDGTTRGTVQDGCGVCGGDGSTCEIVEGVYTDAVPSGSRADIVTLPSGAFLIQIYFTYSDMRNHFIELWDTDGNRVFNALFGGRSDTRSDPVEIAGTEWYFYFAAQFMYAYGPTTSDLIVKVFNQRSSTNTGITYAYSLPSASTTTSTTTTTTSTTPTTTSTTPTTTSTTPTTSTSSTTTTTTTTSTSSTTSSTSTTTSRTSPSTTSSTTSTSTTSSTSPTTSTTTSTTRTTTSPTTSTTQTTTSPTTTSTRTRTSLITTTTSPTTLTSRSTARPTPSTNSTNTSTPLTTITTSTTSPTTTSSTPPTTPPSTTSTTTPSTTITTTSRSYVRNCGWGYLECQNKRCIYYTQMCNGVDDCGDNTDENYIACDSGTTKLQATILILFTSFSMFLHY